MAQAILTDVAELETMITEILEIERLQGGRGGLKLERCDLAQTVRDAIETFADRAPGVRLLGVPRQVMLEIDETRVKTVLKNVLENAFKFSLPDSRSVEVAIEETDSSVLVRITDDGPGIPDEDLENLFEPFFRIDRSRSKKTGGYGLGLSICKRIMDTHGGSIAARNNPGRDASFQLTFPR